jgi:hypothetical protein
MSETFTKCIIILPTPAPSLRPSLNQRFTPWFSPPLFHLLLRWCLCLATTTLRPTSAVATDVQQATLFAVIPHLLIIIFTVVTSNTLNCKQGRALRLIVYVSFAIILMLLRNDFLGDQWWLDQQQAIIMLNYILAATGFFLSMASQKSRNSY